MGRDKKGGPGGATGSSAKDRHKRDRKGNLIDWTAPLPPGLNARPDKPQSSSKHKSWFEFIENKDKKKKLEFEFTEDRRPPPGFEFVPIGNPALTTACKELSREHGAMIFIVTSTYGRFSRTLSFHLNRVGHHIRQSIVEQARESLGDAQDVVVETDLGVPEPIPERQEDIDKQADAAIRDLFPRIPNTDRQMIIQHAFNKSNLKQKNGDPPVGLAPDINLSRRVQLAVLAHIRHNHTRYDQLLRETSYVNARKAVEPLCLDILVKWRGDEETGRDQLDEILCEVIVISDSESDDDADDDDDESESSDTSTYGDGAHAEQPIPPVDLIQPATADRAAMAGNTNRRGDSRPRAPYAHAGRKAKVARKDRRAAIMKAQRGFSRYQAARDEAWHRAIQRQQQHDDNEALRSATVMSIDGPKENRQQWRSPEPNHNHTFNGGAQNTGGASHHPQQPKYGDAWPIVGSRAADSGVQQAWYPHLDLKDHLVRSIEPYSPDTSQFPTQFPGQPYIKPEYGQANASRPRVEPVAYQQTTSRPYNDAIPAQAYHAGREQQDFITLPPRFETGRAPVAPIQYQQASGPVSSHSRFIIRGHSPIDLTGDSGPLPSVYRHSPTFHHDGPILRSEPRPIWIEDDDGTPGSQNRPVPAHENHMQSRQAVTSTSSFGPDRHHLAPARGGNYSPNPAYVDDHSMRQADNRHIQPERVQSHYGDVAEIVRVSNKFPRQHEHPALPVDSQRYELRPRAQQNYDSSQVYDDSGRHSASSAAPQFRRTERVMVRVEEPVYHHDHDRMFAVDRQPAAYSGNFQRQERVVGIEYVPTPHSREVRAYADQPPVSQYVGGDHGPYRQDTSSNAPRTYLDTQYPLRPHQPADGVITVHRRA